MTTAARVAFGAELWMAADGEELVKIAELLSVTPPTMSRETIDATTHDSAAGAMEFIVEGVFDPGEVNFQINYIAGSTGDTTMIEAMTGGVLQDVKIVAKAATSTEDLEFRGFVTSYGPDDMPTNGKQTASGTIKVSGAIAQGPSS